jgi:hypothetical protein
MSPYLIASNSVPPYPLAELRPFMYRGTVLTHRDILCLLWTDISLVSALLRNPEIVRLSANLLSNNSLII